MVRLIVLVCTFLIAFGSGCAKKKDDAAAQEKTPQLEQTVQTENTDGSEDIFDEFYEEETPATETDAPAVEETYTAPASFSGSFAPNGRYVVQVSCVGSQAIGESVVRELEEKGYPAYLAQVESPTPSLPGTYFRVRIGAFNYVSEARSFGETVLIPGGYEFWVDNKSNDNVGMEGYGLGQAQDSYNAYSGQESYTSTETESSQPAATTSDSYWEGSAETATPTAESQAQPAQSATAPEPTAASMQETNDTPPAQSPASTQEAANAEPAPTPAPTPATTTPSTNETATNETAAENSSQEDEWGGDDEWGESAGDEWGSGDSEW